MPTATNPRPLSARLRCVPLAAHEVLSECLLGFVRVVGAAANTNDGYGALAATCDGQDVVKLKPRARFATCAVRSDGGATFVRGAGGSIEGSTFRPAHGTSGRTVRVPKTLAWLIPETPAG